MHERFATPRSYRCSRARSVAPHVRDDERAARPARRASITAHGRSFCYSNADLRKGEEADEVLRFVEFWQSTYGERPRHLVFDSKLTTYANLSQLNQMGIPSSRCADGRPR